MPPFLEAALGPNLKECGLGRGYTSGPSGIFILPTVWPQSTNVTDRTNRSDADRYHCDEIPTVV